MKSSPLATGVSKVNYTAFLFAAFFTIGSFPFVAYCLIPLVVDKFGYTKEEAKSILSCFVAIDQVVNIAFGSVWGWISEGFWGRKAVFSTGLAVMAACIGAFPFASAGVHPMAVGWRSFGLMRFLFGFGASACNVMFLAVASDYANEAAGSGIVAGGAGFAAGLGAVFSVVCMQRIRSYRVMCFSMAVAVGISSAICLLCLKNVVKKASSGGRKNLFSSLSTGFRRCKEYTLLLSMISVFLARSNSLVSMVFVPKDAFTRTFSVCSLVGTLVFGGTLGRWQGTQEIGLLISCCLVAVGYLCTLLDGIRWLEIVCGVLAGLGQGGLIVCGMSLLAKCAKDGEKGALSATFSLFGSVGSLTASSMGYLVKGGKHNWGMIVYIALHFLYLALLAVPLAQRAREAFAQKAHKNCIKIPL